MPKVKIPRKSTLIDMTAMCDVSFLLLTFFMLTTQFRPDEPVVVDTPSSVSETKIPDGGVILLTMDKTGRVFYSMNGKTTRDSVLNRMSRIYNIPFTEKQTKAFSSMESFGVPINQLPALLDKSTEDRKQIKQPGIPVDSTQNELANWVETSFQAYSNEKGSLPLIAIKGDGKANFIATKKLIDALQAKNFNTFDFITTLEGKPTAESGSK